MAGIKYPGTVLNNGQVQFGATSGGWGAAVAGDTFLTFNLEQHRLYLAPGRYSQVRKVIFYLTTQHQQNGGQATYSIRPRIGPSSTSTSARVLETETLLDSSINITQGAGQVWTNSGPNFETALYPVNGSESSVIPRQVGFGAAPLSSDAQTLEITFERFKASDAAFFADWDAAAALGEDDFIAYAAMIERLDGGVFTGGLGDVNRVVETIGLQVVVVQAPDVVNNSCTHLPATGGLYPEETMDGSLFFIQKMVPFFFNAADYDGIDSIHVMVRQTARAGGIAMGHFKLRIFEVFDDSDVVVNIYEEDFGAINLFSSTVVCRTADIKSLLVDGRIYTLTWSSLTGLVSTDLPWGWWEIIQKDFNTKSTFHSSGMGGASSAVSIIPGPPTGIGGFRYACDQTVFDQEWYDVLPSSAFIAQRWYGGIDHQSPNDTDLLIVTDPDFTGDIPTTGGTRISDEVGSTPDADTGNRLRNFILGAGNSPGSRVNPLQLGTPVILKARYNRDDWTSGNPDECPGGTGFQYTYIIGNSEFPELGPLFEVGAFDPEGCASTAAGLGDSPGILVMTNGGTIPKKFNPTAMVVENAGIDTPFRGQLPSVSFISVALSPDGGLTPGIYKYRYTLRNACTGKQSDPNPEDIVVDVTAASPAAEVTLSFAGVVIPIDGQVDQICIYRTIIGGDFPVMALVGCFDIPGTTIFVDNLSDSVLNFIADPLDIFNAPMPCVSVVAEFRNRLWGLGDIPDLDPPGTVSVTLGSDEIQGDPDTLFDRCVLGRFIQIKGDCTAYEVIELLAPLDIGASPLAGMGLKLDRAYEGTTDALLDYIICGHPNRLFISEPLEGECWPVINFLDVDPGDGDRLMGAVSNFNRLVVCKRRKTYVVSFREQPITEIVVPTLISQDIGCISARSFAQVASGSVWLSDRGLVLYDGRGVGMIPESSVMNDLFVNPDNPNYLRRDANGRAIGAAGVYYPRREQYLLLLPTVKTTRGASLVLVWDTELRNITLLEFCQEFLSIEVAKDSDGNERVYLGDSNGFVWIWDIGDTDGVGFPNATGTVRGTITSAGIDNVTGASFLKDSTAGFVIGGVPGLGDLSGLSGLSGLTGDSNMGMAGACVFFRPSDAGLDVPWQSRFVYAANSTTLFVTPNWGPDTPDDTYEYMLGPIEFLAEFKPANYGTDDFSKRDWRQIIVHEPEAISTTLRTELLRDFQNSDVDEDTVVDVEGEVGAGRTYDLGFGQGRQIRPVGRLVHNFMGVRLSNFAPEEPLTIINHVLGVIPRTSK